MKNNQKYSLIKERVEIYRDFTINLTNYIFKYYIDKESLSVDEDIRNHYLWCYKKNCDDFLKENIDFTENKELINYFYDYYYSLFYTKDIPLTLGEYEIFWLNIFNIDKPNDKTFVKMFIELYNIYDLSINKTTNIFELVQ